VKITSLTSLSLSFPFDFVVIMTDDRSIMTACLPACLPA
jgi:hypothetical protein